MDIREIEIPIFLHPHLFWIFWRKDTSRRFQLENNLAEECCETNQKDEHFEIGEVVVVKKDSTWKRALLENILEDGDKKYEVWLLDYGHLEHVGRVFKLNAKFNLENFPALVIQASLWNVVFLDEDFNIESNSIDHRKNQFPNAGTTSNALQFMGDYKLFFKKNKEVNGILFGDIFYKKNGETTSLTASLIAKKLMVEDAELFQQIESNRVNDKVLHFVALRQASRKQKDCRFSFDLSLLMDEVFMRNTSRGISLVNDDQTQSPEMASSKTEQPRSEFLRKLRKKAELRKMETLSCTESEKEETLIENDRNGSVSNDKQISRATRLKNLMNRRKTSNESKTESCTEEVTSGSEVNIKDNNAPSKVLQLPHAVFIPGGMRNIVKVKEKKSNRSSHSESERFKTERKENKSSTYDSDTRSGDFSNACSKEQNCSSSRASMMKKLMSRTKNSVSNANDTSDTEVPKNEQDLKNSVKNKGDQFSISRDSSELNSSIDNSLTEKEKLRNKKANLEKSISSNVTSDQELSKTENESKEQLTSSHEVKDDPENAVDSQMVVKPYCSCVQCNFWTTSEDWGIGSEHFTAEGKCKRKKMRPPSLMLKEKREDNIKLDTINYSMMTKIEKKASFKILVHGRLIPKPIDRVVEAPFHSAIHKSLKNLNYERTKKIQSYIWPAISRSMNVCFIHRNKTGKTLAYLPPLCSFLLEKEERYNDLKKGGPIVTVLGKTTAECEDIYYLANKLMERGGNNRVKTVLVTYPFQYVNLSSVDMLITIPPILIELLKRNATNLKRLCHLVFENLDVLLEKYPDEIKSILSSIESMLLQRSVRQSVQIIVNGEHWTKQVKKFLTKLRDLPLVAIGDYLEAAFYGDIKLNVNLLKAEAKCDAVVEILRDKWKYHKSIIICNTNDEIEKLKISLDLSSISHISITDDLSSDEILQNEYNWESCIGGQFIVLLCTDQMLSTMLTIMSASLVIHFSLPAKWSFCVKRFYCLLENFKSPLIKTDEKLKCEAHILTDELNNEQIPRLFSLLKNHNVSLRQFEPFLEQKEKEKEEEKIENQIPLCSSLKQFGYCHTVRCPKRHLLNRELDECKSLPRNGTIKYKILKLVDVNHLKVTILEHNDIKGNTTEYKSKRGLNDEKLSSVLEQKRTLADNIVKQSSYAYWDQEDFNDMFRECIVEEVKSDVVDILVKFDGRRTTVSKTKIFVLPEEFNSGTETEDDATDLIIAYFKPPYKDEEFSARAFSRLQSYLQQIGYDDNIFVSNICLQLGDTIWVDTVHEVVNVYSHNLTKTNLTKELINKQLAERNEDHMKILYSLCEAAGIVLPKYNVPIEEQINREPPQSKPQWAFLEMDSLNKVYFSSAVTPDEFYVRLVKFDSLLCNLEKDLFDVAMRQGSKQDFAILQGRYYLVKDPIEDKYIRVLLKKIEDDKALCFSVDYGDEFIVPLSDIRYLSNYLIERLPFQAILCRLFGIKSIEEKWPQNTVDILYDNFTFEDDSDIYRVLYAKCILYERGMNKGQSFFSILLKDIYDKPILINQLLLDCGWATLIPGATLNDFEVALPNFESEEDIQSDAESDEVEKIKEIIDTSKSISSNQITPTKNDEFHIEEDNELEFFFCKSGDEVDNFIDFMNVMNKNSTQSTMSTPRSNTLPAIEASPYEVNYFTPDLYWSQTKKKIDISVRLPNVKTYNVKLLRSRIFNLETVVDEKKYVVNLVLYESVEKEFKHILGGLEIKITLMKQKEEEWPKLSRSKYKLKNVHYMLSKEEMEDEDDKGKLFLDLGEDLQVHTDNESDGAIYDVFSDRDSEYDEELPDDIF